MKKILFPLFTMLFYLNSFSQVNFEKGYFINKAGETVNCLIKNADWKNNPKKFDYKLSENTETKTIGADLIKEFGINNISKYVSATVNIDRSSRSMSNLSKSVSPKFKIETLFLKVLVEGNSSLYYFEDGNLIRFFYKTRNTEIEQLVYKSFITSENRVSYNNYYKKQLSYNLKCKNNPSLSHESLEYKEKQLVRVFIKHNTCNDSEYKDLSIKKNTGKFNFSLKARVINSSFETEISNQIADFGNQTNFGFGFELESVFPFNRNKWAVVAEPSFQSYKSEITLDVPGSIRERTLSIEYKTLELAVGARHYLYLNENSKFFIDAFWIVDSPLGSVLKSTRGTTETEIAKARTSSILAFGAGYKFKNKYSIEYRHHGNRAIFGNVLSNYRSMSLILGYTIF